VRNLVGLGDMALKWWDELYSRCCDIIAHPGDYSESCRGKVLAALFYEPSTRTNFSFQSAMLRLGGSVFGFSDPMGTSVAKGETLADTIRIAAAYSDTIVMRSPQEGAAAAAAMYSEVPIVNAGDGSHFHPTQTLADLTTIAQKRGAVENIRVGICGDLKHGRTVHSLVEALSIFSGISYSLISPEALSMPEYILRAMRACGQEYTEMRNLRDAIPGLDILYMTRVQRERFVSATEYERLKNAYILTKDALSSARSDMLIMHPLPRYSEIAPDVDDDPRAVYFEQARFGMFIRMALLYEFANLPRRMQPLPEATAGFMCCNPACVTQSEQYLPQLCAESAAGSKVKRCTYCDAESSIADGVWRIES